VSVTKLFVISLIFCPVRRDMLQGRLGIFKIIVHQSATDYKVA